VVSGRWATFMKFLWEQAHVTSSPAALLDGEI